MDEKEKGMRKKVKEEYLDYEEDKNEENEHANPLAEVYCQLYRHIQMYFIAVFIRIGCTQWNGNDGRRY